MWYEEHFEAELFAHFRHWLTRHWGVQPVHSQDRPFETALHSGLGWYRMHAGRTTAFRFAFKNESRKARFMISAPTMFR